MIWGLCPQLCKRKSHYYHKIGENTRFHYLWSQFWQVMKRQQIIKLHLVLLSWNLHMLEEAVYLIIGTILQSILNQEVVSYHQTRISPPNINLKTKQCVYTRKHTVRHFCLKVQVTHILDMVWSCPTSTSRCTSLQVWNHGKVLKRDDTYLKSQERKIFGEAYKLIESM